MTPTMRYLLIALAVGGLGAGGYMLLKPEASPEVPPVTASRAPAEVKELEFGSPQLRAAPAVNPFGANASRPQVISSPTAATRNQMPVTISSTNPVAISNTNPANGSGGKQPNAGATTSVQAGPIQTPPVKSVPAQASNSADRSIQAAQRAAAAARARQEQQAKLEAEIAAQQRRAAEEQAAKEAAAKQAITKAGTNKPVTQPVTEMPTPRIGGAAPSAAGTPVPVPLPSQPAPLTPAQLAQQHVSVQIEDKALQIATIVHGSQDIVLLDSSDGPLVLEVGQKIPGTDLKVSSISPDGVTLSSGKASQKLKLPPLQDAGDAGKVIK